MLNIWLIILWLWLKRFYFDLATHVMFPRSLYHLHHYIINCFLSQLGYLLSILIVSWSNFNQLNVLVLTLRIHDIMIFGGMNGKLPSKNSFWKWISCGRRKWWNGYFKLSRKIAIEWMKKRTKYVVTASVTQLVNYSISN